MQTGGNIYCQVKFCGACTSLHSSPSKFIKHRSAFRRKWNAGALKSARAKCIFFLACALRGSSQYPTSSQDTQGRFRLGAEIGSPSRCLSRRLMVDLVGNEVCDICTMLPIGLVSRPALALILPNSSSPVLARPSWARRYRDGRFPHPRCIISTSRRVPGRCAISV